MIATIKQYDALVKAVGHAYQIQHEPPDVTKAMDALSDVFKAYKPFLPPASIADRIDALANKYEASSVEFIASGAETLHALAEEVRELEK